MRNWFRKTGRQKLKNVEKKLSKIETKLCQKNCTYSCVGWHIILRIEHFEHCKTWGSCKNMRQDYVKIITHIHGPADTKFWESDILWICGLQMGSKKASFFALIGKSREYTHLPLWEIDLGYSRFSTEIYKSTLGIQDFQQRSQNFDIMMVSWWWFHDLKIWNAQNLIMSNFENQEILIMSKFENIKNLIMSKIEMYQKSDHVKIWESQKSDHVKNENPRFRKKKPMLMSSWKHGTYFLAVFVSTKDSWWIFELL